MKLVEAYSSLCELAGTLVLGVAEQFNDTALVRGETVVRRNTRQLVFKMTEPPMYRFVFV